ncbi:hypothetical protein [Chitinophaga sancti]|uniref:hypothetical protein n=1 Tax=Chitinophaga sancti TaxID=1004 RepID=UPI003F7AC6FB
MKNQFIAMAVILSVFSFTACQQSQSTQHNTTQQVQETTAAVAEPVAADSSVPVLETVMFAPAKVKAGKPILVKFTVNNPTTKEQAFCKWHTPFEQRFLNSFFEVTNSKGEAVPYKGAMAKRVTPPPADTYIKVPAKGSVSAEIDLLMGYKIDAPGTYKVVYQGEGVSGLTKVNEVTINVE